MSEESNIQVSSQNLYNYGFEDGKNNIITVIQKLLKSEKIIEYTELIKLLDELKLKNMNNIKNIKNNDNSDNNDNNDNNDNSDNNDNNDNSDNNDNNDNIINIIEICKTTNQITSKDSISLLDNNDTKNIVLLNGDIICENDKNSNENIENIIMDNTIVDITKEINDKVYITYPSINSGDTLDLSNTKKRGRKRKTFIHKNYYNPNYVALWKEICNGEQVLIDCMNNVFTYDLENPKYIGKYQLDGKIDITKSYVSPINNFDYNYNNKHIYGKK